MYSPLDDCQFTTEQTASLTGIPLSTLQMRLKQPEIPLGRGESTLTRNPKTGRSRLFTGRRVLHIGLTDVLVRGGLPVKAAWGLALLFTDSDDGVGGLGGDALPEATRQAGGLFPDDSTVFRVGFPQFGGDPVASVDRGTDAATSPFTVGNAQCLSVLSVDMDRFVATMRANMGLGQ